MIKHKNYGKSVRTRLLTLMNKTGYRYMYLLTRYFNERLLYRVSYGAQNEAYKCQLIGKASNNLCLS